jgi:lipopolysaccharide/colanic/teichoic acid biosynthesis glycosyltransferase
MNGPFWGGSVLPRWKRVLDFGVILLTSPILGPVMLMIAVAIKIVSRGPVFFRQERVGLNGSPFTCLKFRTMKPDAPTAEHQGYVKDLINSSEPMTKMDDKGDGRLIPGASILRATGLDELPQVINVIRGEMSLVGPRPCTVYEYEHYEPAFMKRFETLPGLTGYWQVNGKNRTTFKEMMKMDAYYASHKSIWMDLKIMLKTPLVLMQQLMERVFNGKEKPKKNEKAMIASV